MTMLPKHMPALDGVRGIAILMVLLTHVHGGWAAAYSIYPDQYAGGPTFDLPRWLDTIGAYGMHGVTLFFVVSAFTLTLSLGARGEVWSYGLRRLARVGPPFWLTLLGYVLLTGSAPRMFAPDGVSALDVAVAAGFGGAWVGGAPAVIVPGGWTISCEVSFYLVLPLLLRLIDGRPWRALALAVVASALVQLTAHSMMAHDGWRFMPQYINPLTQAPVFLSGIAAAVVVQRTRVPSLRGLATALLLFALFVLPFLPIGTWIMLRHLPFAAVMAVVVLLVAIDPPPFLLSPFLRRVGTVSYSMYLIHGVLLLPCLSAADALAPQAGWVTFLLDLVLTAASSFALACLSYRFIERPAVRWMANQIAVSRAVTSMG
jgi:peptidoglycan/LPS O-acetylase OafA/YrhL